MIPPMPFDCRRTLFTSSVATQAFPLHDGVIVPEPIARIVLRLEASKSSDTPFLVAVPFQNALTPISVVDVCARQSSRLASVPGTSNLISPLPHLILKTRAHREVSLKLSQMTVAAEWIGRAVGILVLHGFGCVSLVNDYGTSRKCRLVVNSLCETGPDLPLSRYVPHLETRGCDYPHDIVLTRVFDKRTCS
jgi:hypothetical protein